MRRSRHGFGHLRQDPCREGGPPQSYAPDVGDRARRCAACGRRLGQRSSYCANCGAPRDEAAATAVELDIADDGVPASEVRFAGGSNRRGRLVAGGAIVAAAAAIVVSVTAGGGAGRATPTSTTELSTPTPTTTTTTTTEAPTTVDGAATTTTTAGPVRIGDGPLLGEPTGLALVLPSAGDLYIVDLDAATAQLVRSAFAGPIVDITPLGLVYRGSERPTIWAPGASSAVSIGDSRNGGTFLGDDAAGHLWFQTYGDTGQPSLLRLDSIDGRPVSIAGAGLVDLPDGLGGLLTWSGGGLYRLDADGKSPKRLGTGDLLAVNNGHVLSRVCDAALRCRYEVLDVRTGATRAGPATQPDMRFGAQVSPDGRWIVELATQSVAPGMPDLRAVALDGSRVDLGPLMNGCFGVYCPGGPEWAPKGGWLVWSRAPGEIAFWRPGLDAARVITIPIERRFDVGDVAVDTVERVRAATGVGG